MDSKFPEVPVDSIVKRKRDIKDNQQGGAFDKPSLTTTNQGKYQDPCYCDKEGDKDDTALIEVELRINVGRG
jgi:hypothetical protein